jgi:amino acid transporter
MLNFSLISGFLISLGILSVLFFNTNPFNSNDFTLTAFFAILLFFLICLFALISFWISGLRKKHFNIKKTFRRCTLLAALIVGMLVFSSLNVLNFMSGLTYTIAIILLEFFFSSRKIEKERQ